MSATFKLLRASAVASTFAAAAFTGAVILINLDGELGEALDNAPGMTLVYLCMALPLALIASYAAWKFQPLSPVRLGVAATSFSLAVAAALALCLVIGFPDRSAPRFDVLEVARLFALFASILMPAALVWWLLARSTLTIGWSGRD